MTTTLQTNPGSVTIGTTDYPEIACDMTALLQNGETIDQVACRLQSISPQMRQVALADFSTFVGNVVFQRVNGATLTPSVIYRLIWIVTLSSGDVISQQTTINVPY